MSHDIVIFMPIRMNSVRVKEKSIKLLAGRPLFCWSLEKLDSLGVPVFVFSSSCAELEALIDFDVSNINFCKRDESLDEDSVVGIEIYKEFSKIIDSKNYILTHCTSPFINIDTYEDAISALSADSCKSVISAKKVQTFIWFDEKMLNFSIPRVQTQLLKPIFIETSGIYGYKKDVLNEGSRTSKDNFVFIELNDAESIDIDTEDDFAMAEIIGKGIKACD